MATNYLVRLLEPNEFTIWDQLVAESPQGSIFSKSFWFTAISTVYKLDYKLYGCFKENDLVGGIGVFHTKRWGKKWVFRPLLTPYHGVIIKRSTAKPRKELKAAQGITEALITALEKHYDYLKLDHHWTLEDVLPFTWAGWQAEVLYTVLIPLDNPEALFASLDRRDRTPIKTAQQLGFSCHVEHDYEEFYRLFDLTFAKQNKSSALSREKFLQLVESLSALGACRVYLLKTKENQNIAGMVVLLDDNSPYAWVGGTDPAYLTSGAASFLMWEIIRDLARDFSFLDLGVASIKPITRFKKNMGGVLRPYYTTTKIKSPLIKAIKLARGITQIWN